MECLRQGKNLLEVPRKAGKRSSSSICSNSKQDDEVLASALLQKKSALSVLSQVSVSTASFDVIISIFIR